MEQENKISTNNDLLIQFIIAVCEKENATPTELEAMVGVAKVISDISKKEISITKPIYELGNSAVTNLR